ncbi:MAG: TOBE domain-containing protein, partial [Alphaproteobacteria bacterium]
VAENIGFGLKLAGTRKDELRRRVREAADILQLTPLLERKPKALSGGQRQRVAIGRAIVRKPKVFLFDEPLSNLDAALRAQMRLEIGRLHRTLKATMIYVTHDQVEAMTLADRIVVLEAGRVRQIGAPLELYERPANRFVAGFIGSPKMNFLACEVVATDSGSVQVAVRNGAGGRVVLTLLGRAPPKARDAILGFRPEHVELTAKGGQGLLAEILEVEKLGSDTFVHLDIAGREGSVSARIDPHHPARPGDHVAFTVNAAHCHLFETDGTACARLMAGTTIGKLMVKL